MTFLNTPHYKYSSPVLSLVYVLTVIAGPAVGASVAYSF